MSRVARKSEVASTFFRVDGADLQTGEETYLVLQASTKPQAEKLARKQGLLISSVRVARPDDWQATATASAAEPPAAPSVTAMDALAEPATAPAEASAFREPPAPPPAMPAAAPAAEPNYRDDYPGRAASFVDPAPPTMQSAPQPVVEPAAAADGRPQAVAAPAGGSSAAAVVLGCIGAALVIGGALALALALWPDNAVRNELQQIDYRLHELSQTILGGMLVLSGMMTFTLSIICHLLPKRGSRT